jgi:dihydrofolate reductase
LLHHGDRAVAALKADANIKGILIPGSISVVQQLLAAGLVDELRRLVYPVAAPKGRRLFDDGDEPYHLKVTATEAFPTGVIRVIYTHQGTHQGRLRRGQGPGARWEVAASAIRGRCPSRPARR